MPERELRGVKLRNQEGSDKPEGTYTVSVSCFNCNWEGEAEIPKGIAVDWGGRLEKLARCTTCGCHTLERFGAEEMEEAEEAEEATGDPGVNANGDAYPPIDSAAFREAIRRLTDAARRPPGAPYPEAPAPAPLPPHNPMAPYAPAVSPYIGDMVPESVSGSNSWTSGGGTVSGSMPPYTEQMLRSQQRQPQQLSAVQFYRVTKPETSSTTPTPGANPE